MKSVCLVFWAKSGDADHPSGHPLLAHMLDTAAVAHELLLREPGSTRRQYAEDLGLNEEQGLRLAAFFAGLHDLGKATAIFQIQWPDWIGHLRKQGLDWIDDLMPRRGDDHWAAHGVLTKVLAEPLLSGLGIPGRVASQVASALGAHHGFIANPKEIGHAVDALELENKTWSVLRTQLVSLLWKTLDATPPGSSTLSPEAALHIMALASFTDWVASSPEYFPYGRDPSSPVAYFNQARKLAQKALDRIRWYPRTPLSTVEPSFEQVFPGFKANPLQRQVGAALQRAQGPAMIIIEAPMGGGKTEAALYAHTVLQARNGHRGMYVAMPTQATGNAMFTRVKHFLDRFGETRPLDLQLLHGASLLNPDYQSLRPQKVGEEPGEGVTAGEWFSAKKRALLSEYGVGTVDQALLGVLRVKHHFIRLWGLGNRTVVLDEVHAYDAYTSRLIAGLVRWLKGLSSSVVIMSATLTQRQRAQLAAAYGDELPAKEAPYPRITTFSDSGASSHGFPWPEQKTIHLAPGPREPQGLAQKAEDLVRAGGVAALIVNTVDRAQQAYRALGPGTLIRHNGQIVGKRLGELEVYLFHARYPSNERKEREEAVLEIAGKGGRRPHKAIVIATQVIEQSLDLDFDVMLSDLAPMDLLIQRAGRLHRHDRPERPKSHMDPRLFVGGLADEPPSPLPKSWGLPYLAYPLLSAWLLLHARNQIVLPDDIEPLVEEAYGADTLQAFPSSLRATAEKAFKELGEQVTYSENVANNAVLDPPARLLDPQVANLHSSLGLDDDEEAGLPQVALTRLGEPSITAVPAFCLDGALYMDREGKIPLRTHGQLSKEELLELVLRSVKIGRKDVYYALARSAVPPAWRKKSLVSHWRVLELDPNASAQFGKTSVQLDPELGLVFATIGDAKEE